MKGGARLELAAGCQHSSLGQSWWKSYVPCLGCLKKYTLPPSLFHLCFFPGPKNEEAFGCQMPACRKFVFKAMSRDANGEHPAMCAWAYT